MKKNEKNIQYNIFKSEACGHSIEYKMVKAEEKKPEDTITNQLVSHAKEGKKTGIKKLDNIIADAHGESRMATPSELSFKNKETKKNEEETSDMEKCIDNPDCGCQKESKKLMKKSEKFYIQKIQELRKAFGKPTQEQIDYQRKYSPSVKAAYENSLPKIDTAAQGGKLADSLGMPSAQEMTRPLVQTSQPVRTPDLSPQQNFDNAQNYNKQVKTASNNFIGNLANANPAANAAAQQTNTAAPIPNSPYAASQQYEQEQKQTAQAPAAQAPAANPAAQAPAAKQQSFGEKFKEEQAKRQKMMAEGVYDPNNAEHNTFKWTNPSTGKESVFHNFSKDDFTQGLGAKYNPGSKNPATQAPAERSPALEQQASPANFGGTTPSSAPKMNTGSPNKFGPTTPTPADGQLKETNTNKMNPAGGPV